MAIVAGVDFGTLSVRVSIVERERGVLSTALSEYPLHRKREDPEFATQSHDDQMRALAAATREVVQEAGISGEQVQALAMDTTCSSVIPVGKNLEPLDGYYLWCDHRAKKEAAEITEAAIAKGLPPFSGAAECIRPRGGSRSCCTGCGTIQKSAPNSFRPSSIATWPWPRCAESPTLAK
jgi:ribulose kinase